GHLAGGEQRRHAAAPSGGGGPPSRGQQGLPVVRRAQPARRDALLALPGRPRPQGPGTSRRGAARAGADRAPSPTPTAACASHTALVVAAGDRPHGDPRHRDRDRPLTPSRQSSSAGTAAMVTLNERGAGTPPAAAIVNSRIACW